MELEDHKLELTLLLLWTVIPKTSKVPVDQVRFQGNQLELEDIARLVLFIIPIHFVLLHHGLK